MASELVSRIQKNIERLIGKTTTVLRSTLLTAKRNPRLLIEIVAVVGVVGTAIGVWLQYTQFREEAFNRQHAGFAQAWGILASANGIRYDIGQRDALEFLASNGRLSGHLRLEKFEVAGLNFEGHVAPERFNFKYSSLCQSSIFVSALQRANFRYSVLGGVAISAILDDAKFDGAFMRRMHFMTGSADRARFVAADLRDAIFRGGSYVGANFDGADMRGAQFVALKEYDQIDLEWKRATARRSAFDREAPEDAHLLQTDENYVSDVRPISEEVVRLDGASFKWTDLRAADLTGSNMTQEQLDKACVDPTTKLPRGLLLRRKCVIPKWVSDRVQKIRGLMLAPTSDWKMECEAALSASD